MKVYKEKQYLIFDFENGQTVKYDFATKTAIGKRGKPVKNLNAQLSNMTMNELIDCCTDEKYAKFLKFVQDEYPYAINNIGTILSKVPRYANYEQIFSAGLDVCVDSRFHKKINEIPKSLIKMAQTHNLTISDNFVDYWTHNPNAYIVAYQLEYLSLNDKDITGMLNQNFWNHIYPYEYVSYYNALIDSFGYNPKSLMLYIDRLVTFEAISPLYIFPELYDYAKMMAFISPKYDKYPKNFLTTHTIACRNFNRLKQEFSEDLFKKRIRKNYECTFGDYQFIYPSCTQDIKDEAVAQNNCVASYIDQVINGECHIMFLRKKDSPEKSLVTIEIRDNKIIQARRKYDDFVTHK